VHTQTQELAALGLLEAPRRAQKIEISYARTAKKVDIKALKDDLWEQIDTINPEHKKIAAGIKTQGVAFMGETKQVWWVCGLGGNMRVGVCVRVCIFARASCTDLVRRTCLLPHAEVNRDMFSLRLVGCFKIWVSNAKEP